MLKIFIGTSANGEDAEAEVTLEYTIRKNTKSPVEIVFMRQTRDIKSVYGGWNTSDWHTPFSGFRWAIPHMCNFEGRAVYMDIDQICLQDMTELFNEPIGKDEAFKVKMYGGRYEYSVILFDNAKCKDVLPSLSELKAMPDIMQTLPQILKLKRVIGLINPKWNVLDGEDYSIDQMGILHYTRMASQPWQPKWFQGVVAPHQRPELCELWFNLNKEAKDAGNKPPNDYEPFGEYDIIGK